MGTAPSTTSAWLRLGLGCLWLAGAGGLFAQSTVFLRQRSDPAGIIADASNPVLSGTPSSTSTAPLQSGSYQFTHWTINGVRQSD